MNTLISVHQARRNLGELLNQAFYQGTPFILMRGKKPMGTLIGIEQFKKILLLIEKYDPGLADTLALMSNPDVQDVISQGDEDVKEGNLIALKDV